MTKRIAVTGANGAVGRAILAAAIEDPELSLVALVRSERAEKELPELPGDRAECRRIDYAAPESLTSALAGAEVLVHLPGVLVERPGSSYEEANVETTRVALDAARAGGISKVILVSAIGADSRSPNRFFRTKGEADELVRASGLSYTILRTPLLLGPGTEGSRALRRECARSSCWLIGGGRTLHRPLDVADLARAVVRAARDPDVARDAILDLTGPEPLPYCDLVARAAKIDVRVRALPAGVVRLALWLRTKLFGPGFSPDALDVLLTDTHVEPEAACDSLGIQLSALDDTIRMSLEDCEKP